MSSSSPTSVDPASNTHLAEASSPIRSNDMVNPTQPLDVNTLHNIHVAEEFIQLTVGLDAEIIATSKILRKTLLSNIIKAAASVFNRVHASAP